LASSASIGSGHVNVPAFGTLGAVSSGRFTRETIRITGRTYIAIPVKASDALRTNSPVIALYAIGNGAAAFAFVGGSIEKIVVVAGNANG